jgi:hypothetical protein
MRFIFATILFVVIISPAAAAGDQKASITYNQALEIQNALGALDDAKYEFPGTFLIAKFRDIAAVKADLEAFNAARQGMIAHFAGAAGRFPPAECGDPKVPTTCRVSDDEFRAGEAITKLAATPHEVALVRLRLPDFNLDKNKIPGTVMAALVPILDE